MHVLTVKVFQRKPSMPMRRSPDVLHRTRTSYVVVPTVLLLQGGAKQLANELTVFCHVFAAGSNSVANPACKTPYIHNPTSQSISHTQADIPAQPRFTLPLLLPARSPHLCVKSPVSLCTVIYASTVVFLLTHAKSPASLPC